MIPFYKKKLLIIKRANDVLLIYIEPEDNRLVTKLFADLMNMPSITFNPETNVFRSDVTIEMLAKIISIIEVYNSLSINTEVVIQTLESFNSGSDLQIILGGLENINVVSSDSAPLETNNHNLNIDGIEDIDMYSNHSVSIEVSTNVELGKSEMAFTFLASEQISELIQTNFGSNMSLAKPKSSNISAVLNLATAMEVEMFLRIIPPTLFDFIGDIKTDVVSSLTTKEEIDYIKIKETMLHDVKADLLNIVSKKTTIDDAVNLNNSFNLALLMVVKLFNLYPIKLSERYGFTLKEMSQVL